MGQAAEARARGYLEAKGWVCVTMNYKKPFGEIDLIMQDGTTLVFVEVRSRTHGTHGGASASITFVKQQRLKRAAQAYLQKISPMPPCRFDVIAIEGERMCWVKNAIMFD